MPRSMDRHVIAKMSVELGAATSVFPGDDETRRFLAMRDRIGAYRELRAEQGAGYDAEGEIDLSVLEPLIAKPQSPGNVDSFRRFQQVVSSIESFWFTIAVLPKA